MDRYNQDSGPSSLAIDAPEASPLLGLFHPNNGLGTASSYTHDSSSFYPASGSIFPDGRLRLNTNSTPSTGMAHVQLHNHRTTTLPHLGPHINNSRDQFPNSVAPYRRVSDQFTRSPSFHGSRRQQLTGSQNPLTGYTPPVTRMDSSHQFTHRPGQNDVPPLLPMEMMGTLQYLDPNMTNIKPDISGVIDKGPFLSSDREWTCYRRNYLACICSFSLSPSYPGAGIQFTPTPMTGTSTTQTFQVYGFAMCISAVVADNEQHAIELVQHTPKRDKGPISKPCKTPIAPKTSATPHNPSLSIYGDGSGLSSSRSLYADGFGGQTNVGQQVPTEHTFERIQFKQATQNNGKRRAAQQYYHLVVELWADVGTQATEQFVKVAFRKSAKMIVRGRSPGHYQNERRNSQGNGTGGAAGSGGYRSMGPMGDFGNGSGMTGPGLGGYNSAYDGRGTNYNNVRHQEMSPESIFSSGDDKPSNKAYQYYAGGAGSSSSYESHSDRVDLFGHRNGTDTLHSSLPSHATNERKVKPEFDFNMLPSPFSGGARTDDHHRERFDGRPSPGGFYPSIVPPTGLGAL
ncbi:hypothetical protein J3458_001940 [Metarhizium acridum]|uniref:uncharacterized protein n=1 Tax=Metarhizium acridum TaxID=92637 RepID=UPI001C6BF042|nr:hypothetical protein J3458_001940 [Metarhizium acridum]